MSRKIYQLFILVLLNWDVLQGQNPSYPCAASEMQRVLFEQNPALLLKQQNLDETLHEQVQRRGNQPILRGAAIFVLPVVVHIVHQNGAENISAAQVQNAIQHLNDAFAHEGYYADMGNGNHVPIQFCLAQRTPDNQASNGITREVSPLTTMSMESDDSALKKLNPWDSKQYVNIWVVRDINSQAHGNGVAGYAYYASAHGLSIDGIVCEARYFGNSPANDVVLIHEVGHYLNLYHTFEGGCSNNNCELEGDRVCDTPPDQAKHTGCLYNSCTTDADDIRPLNPLKTDGNDLTENYLDYSPFSCQHAFTPGQGARMLAALQTIRASLLDSPGCLPPCSQQIVADMTIPPKIVVGTPVAFTFNGSGATKFEWKLEGTGFSTQQNPGYTFTQVGTYTLEVTARNSDVNCFAVKKVKINVLCNAVADFTPKLNMVKLGDQVTFSSTGTNLTNYEWSVNGTVVGTGKNYTHTFNTYGDYQVQLKVSNANCSAMSVQGVSMQAPCGDFLQQYAYEYALPELSRRFKAAKNGDLMAAGQGKANGFTAVLMKWNDQDELEWIKKENNPDWNSWDVAPLSDGNWVYVKKHRDSTNWVELTKINSQGNLNWSRRFRLQSSFTFENRLISLEKTQGFLLNAFHSLSQFDNAGNLVWSKTLPKGVFLGGVQRSDGLVLVLTQEDSGKASLLLLNGQGNVLKQNTLNGLTLDAATASVHALSNSSAVIRIYDRNLARLIQVDGNLIPRWSKELPSSGGLVADLVISKNDDVFFPFYELNKIDALAFNKQGNYLWSLKLQGLQPGSGVPYLDGWKFFAADLKNATSAKSLLLKLPATQLPEEGCFFTQGPPAMVKDVVFTASTGTIVLNNFLVKEIPTTPFTYSNIASVRQTVCRTANPCPEICDNDIDDNGDGLIDCADPTCLCRECLQLPDGIISTVDSMLCQGDSLKVYLKICNQGQGPLRASTPIAFYKTDPTISNAIPLASLKTIGVNIPSDTCISRGFVIKAPGTNPIFAVLNDNYRRPRPYTLERYLIEGTPECNYLNNKFQFTYNVPPTPQLDLGPDRTVCSNSVTVLKATSGFARYRWFDGSTDSTFTAFSPGVYWVDVWDACGNLQSDSIRLKLQPLGEVDLGPNRSICAGDTLQLSVTGFAQIKWWPQQGLNCDTCRNIIAKPDTTTRYYVTARQGNCFAGDSILIVVNQGPRIQLEIPDTLTCTQNQVQLKLDPVLNPTKIQWYDSNNQTLNGSNPTVTIPGWYTVLAADSSGLCTTRDSVQVLQNIAPPKLDLGPDRILCSDSSLQLLGPLVPDLKYQWNTGATSPSIAVSQTGTYILEIINKEGCKAKDSLMVNFNPRFTFNLGLDTTICSGEMLRLPVQGIDADFYRWSTGAQSAFIEVNKAGLYILEGIKDDCSWRDSIQVKLEDCSLFAVYVPNAMSPSSTVNQRFHPFFNQKTEILSYQFDIYDRWGEMVFHSLDQQESWDGTKKGERCLQGVYVWTLRVRYRENEKDKAAFKVGEVLLLR